MLTLPTTLLLIFALSLVTCLALTPVLRSLASRWGLVDRPDGRRKIHTKVTPVAGGLALLVSATVGLAVVLALADPGPGSSALNWRNNSGILLGIFLASLVICAVGVVDDYVGLRGRHKLLGQLAAIGVVMSFGLCVRTVHFLHWRVELGILAVPFTVFWLLGAINSLNLIDGMDGLLSSVGLIICGAVAVMAALGGQLATAGVAIALAGALLGFLRYNYPPATIFLGDSGSMLIGLVVGVLAIHSALKGPATIALAAPLAVLTIPILDTSAAIIRRKLTGRSIYTTDRGHMHHCMQRRGFSPQRVLLCISFLCLLTVVGVLASQALKNELYAILMVGVVVLILLTTGLFGHAELTLIKKRLVATTASFFRGVPNGPATQMRIHLQGSANWNELWDRLTERAVHLDLKMVHLDVNAPAIHERYHARWDRSDGLTEAHRLWSAELPLTSRGEIIGRLELSGERNGESAARTIVKLSQLLKEIEATVETLTGAVNNNGAEPYHATVVPTRGHPPAVVCVEVARDTPEVRVGSIPAP